MITIQELNDRFDELEIRSNARGDGHHVIITTGDQEYLYTYNLRSFLHKISKGSTVYRFDWSSLDPQDVAVIEDLKQIMSDHATFDEMAHIKTYTNLYGVSSAFLEGGLPAASSLDDLENHFRRQLTEGFIYEGLMA